jgi:hypothetical protein
MARALRIEFEGAFYHNTIRETERYFNIGYTAISQNERAVRKNREFIKVIKEADKMKI